MSGLSNVLSAAAGAARIFDFKFDGQPPLRVADRATPDAVPLEKAIDSGAAKSFYGEVAKTFGYNPATARANPEQHARVMARLSAVIDTSIAQAKSGARSGEGIADQFSDLRSALATVVRSDDRAATAKINAAQLGANAGVANLPGAALFATPAAQAALATEARIAANLPGPIGKAAQAGLAAGGAAAAAAALATLRAGGGEAPVGTAPSKSEATPPENQKPNALAAAAVLLDVNKDGKLVCKEIGRFVDDPQYAARETSQPNTNRYQDFISGQPGKHFVVPEPARASGEIAYDACEDGPVVPEVGEAKARHGDLMSKEWFQGGKALVKQGREQVYTATRLGVNLEWHAQTETDQKAIQDLFDGGRVPIAVNHTPMPEKPRR